MKNLILLLILFLIITSAHAQFTVKGKAKDFSSIPIANARVTLFDSDTTIFYEKRTNTTGRFTIKNVPAGIYSLGVAAVGKNYEEITVSVSSDVTSPPFILENETEQGAWDIIVDSPEPLGGTDLGVLLPNGKIFYCHNTEDPFVFDPQNNNVELITGDDAVQGCVGPVLLPEGKVIFAGGTDMDVYGPGTKNVKTYDPVNDLWEDMPDMLDYRWYPTITKLADNRLLITGGGGLDNPVRVKTTEIYDPATGTSEWVDDIAIGNEVSPVVLLYNGKVLMTHRPPQLFNPADNQWELADDFVQGNRSPGGEHSDHELVLLPEGKVVAVGYKSFSNSPGNFIEFYNPNTDNWSLGDNFSPVRSQAKALLTPDKKILVMAGYKEEASDPTPTNVYGFMGITDLYDPYNGTWRRLDDLNYKREYHSLAILVPDGRIIITGGEGAPGNEPPFSVIEAFTPPYLLRGVRPEINGLSSTDFQRSQTVNFSISKTKNPTSVILMSNAVVTHFMNSGNNRYIELPFTKTGTMVNATLPSDSVALPDGYYMLFAMVDDIPSTAKIVRIQGSVWKIQGQAEITLLPGILMFPNPASEEVTLQYSLQKEQNIKISLHDAGGKEIKIWQSGIQPKGTHSQTLNLNGLAKGSYMIIMKGDHEEMKAKLIVD